MIYGVKNFRNIKKLPVQIHFDSWPHLCSFANLIGPCKSIILWNPNCVGDNKAYLPRYSVSLLAMRFFITFEKKGKTEIGLYLVIDLLSPDLNIGVIFAILKLSGTKPRLKEEFIMLVKGVAMI